MFYIVVQGNQIPHITQISAAKLDSSDKFNKYVIPKLPITTAAENVTKISMVNDTDMVVSGQSVEALPVKTALEEFLSWIEQNSKIMFIW